MDTAARTAQAAKGRAGRTLQAWLDKRQSCGDGWAGGSEVKMVGGVKERRKKQDKNMFTKYQIVKLNLLK